MRELDFRQKPMDREVRAAAADMRDARDALLAALTEVGPSDWTRYVPYGDLTLHELLSHVASADQAWAVAAQGLLKGEGADQPPLTPDGARDARARAIVRGRKQTPEMLIEEMAGRRKLLLSLYELLEQRHLTLPLKSFGDQHNSVRERIWRGYHDRLHAADIRRAMRLRWHPKHLKFLSDVSPAVEALSPDMTLYVIYSVDPVEWERPSAVPGWSYRDLLAHIATGDWVLQVHLRALIDGGAPAAWPDIDAGNAECLAERRFSTVTALTEEYLSMRHETLILLAQIKPRDLDQRIEFWWEPRPNSHSVLEYLQMFDRHERAHREQLRPAMRYLHARA